MQSVWTDHISVVLSRPTHAGNVGAAARAMRVMGLTRLTLVEPAPDPLCDEARVRASGAENVLEATGRAPSIAEAVASAELVLGASGRRRDTTIEDLDVRQAAARSASIVRRGGQVAVVFGTERTGLTNEELAPCHARLVIPTAPDFRSLNLAAAVQIVCYELRAACEAAEPTPDADSLERATSAETEHFFAHWLGALEAIGYHDPDVPANLRTWEELRRIVLRAGPTRRELQLLHGVQSRTLSALERARQSGSTDDG